MRVVDHHGRVLVEADISSVTTTMLLAGADDDRLDDLTLLDGAIGRGFLDRSGYDVAEPGLFPETAAQRQDHLQLPRAGVIGHREHGSHLYSHGIFSLLRAFS